MKTSDWILNQMEALQTTKDTETQTAVFWTCEVDGQLQITSKSIGNISIQWRIQNLQTGGQGRAPQVFPLLKMSTSSAF